MYMRLWWKDARQFWPIWAFLVLAAAVTQDLVLRYAGPEARNGILGVLALGWTSLYAVAVGAAAFAGEREAGTLRLLDILPASRWDVWGGKVSFAFGTTLTLAVALLAMAALGTDRWGPRRDVLAILEGLPLGGVVLQALGWGLFFSSVMSNALLAATATICLTGLSSPVVVMRLTDLSMGRETRDPGQVALEQLMLVLVTVGASLIAFTWPRRPRRAPRPLAIRYLSPVVETWGGSPRPARRMSMPLRSPVVLVREPVPVPAVAADEPRPRSWRTEARALAWETIREGRPTWYVLAAIGLILPGALLFVSDGRIDPMPLAVWNWLVALVAGVSVFGLENRAGTARFLVHHGARPGIVWLAKLATWCFGLAVIWVPLAMLVASSPGPVGQRSGPEGLTIVLTIPLGFAVAQLCGMAIRRGITAGVVALVVATALGITEGALVLSRMMSAWGLLVLPVALLGASWAWSDDWLFNRPAPGRWFRLGAILAGMSAVLLGGYTAERAWGIPDVGPIPPPLAWLVAAEPLPGDRNAADLYREAGRLLGQLPTTNLVIGSSPGTRKALERIRDAAAEPDCLFHRPARLTLLNLADLPPMDHLAELVIADARDRQQRGDLDGAWDDIAVVLRMARHTGEGATMSQARQALEIEKQALDLAMEWAAAPGQTPERLRGAIAAYHALPRMIPAPEVVRAEATLIERTLELPAADLQSWLLDPMGRNQPNLAGVGTVLWGELITTPWERARAVRAIRSYAAAVAPVVARAPWQRPFGGITHPTHEFAGPLANDLESTPLMKRLLPNLKPFLDASDRNEVTRRALVHVLAIRAWQLRHGGRFPDRLEDLMPEELPSLPADPFSGQGFRYSTQAQSTQIEPSSWVKGAFLVSVGPVRLRDGGGAISPGPAARSPLVFPLPPLQTDAGASKPEG